ncbi:MAG: SPOR domain-containing protein [Pseudomonadota bacterium]
MTTLALCPHVHAQTVSESQPGSLYKAGQDAFANGQYKAAVRNFAKVLRSSELEGAAVAKALYMRGLSHEKAGQPAQAIADLTSALFLSGLSSSERAKAYLSRGKAYEAVGLNDLGRADISRARNGGVSEQQIARASQPSRSSGGGGSVPTFATSTSSSGGGGAASPSFSTRSNSRRTTESVPTFATRSQTTTSRSASAPAPSNAQRTASFQTRSSAPKREPEIPQFRTSILPQEAPAQNRAAPKPPPARSTQSSGSAPTAWDTSAASQQSPEGQESGTRVGRWFRGLRNNVTGRDEKPESTSAPAPPPPAPSTTAAPPAAAPPQWRQTTTASRAPQPSWSSQVSAPAQRTAAAPQAAPPAAAPRPASGGGGYRIQLAALRSDAEAQATWKRLRAKHGALLGSYQPNIVKTELGGLGTFYRVQLGPFPDKAATQQLCKNFKSGGLDCFLLAQ